MRYNVGIVFNGVRIGLIYILLGLMGNSMGYAVNQSSSDLGVYVNMGVISQIESSNNPLAYNKRSKAVGLYQITPICLADYNIYHKNKQYNNNDLYNSDINYNIAYWYLNVRIPQLLKHYKQIDNIDNRLIAYNAGVKYVIDKAVLPLETVNYLEKYHRMYK